LLGVDAAVSMLRVDACAWWRAACCASSGAGRNRVGRGGEIGVISVKTTRGWD